MRLFIHEYTCGSSLADHPELADLRSEGRAMLAAVLADAARLADLDPHTLLDPSCGLDPPAGIDVRWRGEETEEQAFRAAAAAADVTWIVAPECDDILVTRCRWAEEAGARSLNCSLAALALAGDKLATAECWRRHGLATPAALPWPGPLPPEFFPAVCKPRHGAGSQATRLVKSADELERVESAGAMILTRYAPGQPASMTWLIGPRLRVPLLAGRQLLSHDGRFHYLGGELPLPAELAARASRLCQSAIEAMPGLHGFVGIDLVLGAADDGSDDTLIELNPRLTTSYLGLRELARGNLVQALLEVTAGREPPLSWHAEPVRFTPQPAPFGTGLGYS